MSFLVPDDLIEVSIDYIELNPSHMLFLTTDEQKEKLKGKYKTAIAKFRRPTFGSFNLYTKDCIKEDLSTQETYLDAAKLRENKIRTLLVELSDGDGKPVILNEQFFMNVNPDFAVQLAESLDNFLDNERYELIIAQKIFEIEDEDESEDKSEENSEKIEE